MYKILINRDDKKDNTEWTVMHMINNRGMLYRILILAVSSLLLLLPLNACSSSGGGSSDEPELEDGEIEVSMDDENDVVQLDDEDLEKAGDTLQARMPLLREDGWKADGLEYVLTTDDEGTSGEYRIAAIGNDATLTVAFDYGDGNAEMVKFYKDEPDAVKGIAGYWYMRATGVLGVYEGKVNYTLKVGDKVVGQGSMTFDEAAAATDNYFQG